MHDTIPDPVRGKYVLEWAVPVTRALNALHDKTGATVRNERDRRDRPPHPFEVRWSGEANSGDGAWVIWLPDLADAVMYDGSYVTPTGVTAADELVDGWYTVDDLGDSGDVYLNLTVPDSGSASAAFASSAGQSATGTTVLAIKIATATASTDDDDLTTHHVTQLVTSSVTIGGNSSTLSATGTVVTSVDYVTSQSDPDFYDHKYEIRIKRGRLSCDAATGALSVVEDPQLKQFIGTTPHSYSMDYDS